MIQIDRATLDDLDELAELFNLYRVFYGQSDDLEGARRFLRERLANDESAVFVASLDREQHRVGFTQLFPSFSSIRMFRVWILNDLFVHPEARKRGVARALMDAARAFAVDSGGKRLEVVTATENHAAQSLYESLGYERVEGFIEYQLPV